MGRLSAGFEVWWLATAGRNLAASNGSARAKQHELAAPSTVLQTASGTVKVRIFSVDRKLSSSLRICRFISGSAIFGNKRS